MYRTLYDAIHVGRLPNLFERLINELCVDFNGGSGNLGEIAGEVLEDLAGCAGAEVGIGRSPLCIPHYVLVVFFYHAALFVRTVPVYVAPVPVGYQQRHIPNQPANLAWPNLTKTNIISNLMKLK